jgi:hypothetical protein
MSHCGVAKVTAEIIRLARSMVTTGYCQDEPISSRTFDLSAPDGILAGKLLFVDGQAVEPGPEGAGEIFEAIQGSLLLEDGGVTLDGVGTVENPGATTGGFLGVAGVGGRIYRLGARRVLPRGKATFFAVKKEDPDPGSEVPVYSIFTTTGGVRVPGRFSQTGDRVSGGGG